LRFLVIETLPPNRDCPDAGPFSMAEGILSNRYMLYLLDFDLTLSSNYYLALLSS